MVVLSLGMQFARVGDEVEVRADWLKEPIRAASFHAAYWQAVAARPRP